MLRKTYEKRFAYFVAVFDDKIEAYVRFDGTIAARPVFVR